MPQKRVVITNEKLVPLMKSEVICYKLCQRGLAPRVRHTCNSTDLLWDITSLPCRFKIEVYNRRPNLKGKEETKSFIESIDNDIDVKLYNTNLIKR